MLVVVTIVVVIAVASLDTDIASKAAKGDAGPVARQPLAPGGAVKTRQRSQGPVPTLAQKPSAGRYFAIVQVRSGAHVQLFAAPGGKFVRSLGARTPFGSPQVLAVARERGSWFGVTTPALPDGKLGWLRFDPERLGLYWTRYSLRVLLSNRTLQLRYGQRVLARYPVTVGAAGSATPTGRFGITDALDFGESPYYGCCALALSGRQSHLPVGWLGGDRIAIHGTPGPVGYAASHGCIRATDAAMRVLFRRVPLGTPVFVFA